ETLHHRRQRWSTLLHSDDYRTVITEVLEQELPKYSTSSVVIPTSLSPIMSECILILASAPLIFTAAVDGVLPRRYLQDTHLQAEYEEVQNRAHIQPSIYIHLLADEHGLAPTANQLYLIRQMVLDYLDERAVNHGFALLIDNVSQPPFHQPANNRTLRKYLATHSTPRSAQRIATLLKFCEGIHKRWLDTPPHLRDAPLTYPPGECGYARNSHARLEQHRRHISSNYVMNLVEDICTHLYTTNRFPQHFRMHQFIIYLIFQPTQAEIAEIFCSGLLQVWVENGGGFNHYPAGRSNRSAREIGEREWQRHEAYAREESGLVQNLRVQRERVED
ncbi:hypothetical protein K491DRAFT_554836, partial [Lophiostoma macrostomum CBS 122681]